MALDGKLLGDAIVAAIELVDPTPPFDGGTEFLKQYWEAVGTAIVAYFVANTAVHPGSFTNGGGSVTGTGTIS